MVGTAVVKKLRFTALFEKKGVGAIEAEGLDGGLNLPDQQPDRLACNWMLGSAALAIAVHYDHLPVWLSAITACILLWRFFIENHAWRIPGRLVRWLLLLLSAVMVFKHYGTILGRDAGVAYLALLVALKILETRSLRDW